MIAQLLGMVVGVVLFASGAFVAVDANGIVGPVSIMLLATVVMTFVMVDMANSIPMKGSTW